MPSQHLKLTRDASVATVAMARPEVHNAFNEVLIAELHAAFTELGSDAGVRVVVLAGEGKSFSAGADLDWMKRMASMSEAENRADSERLAAMLRAVAECPKPVVARVHGPAMGGGAGLVACADIAVADEAATIIAFSEVRLGLAPATIAPHVIAKVGPGVALPLFLTGEKLSASQARYIGLVHRVASEGRLDESVAIVVKELLAGSPASQRAIKEMVRKLSDMARDEMDAYTSRLIAAMRASEEGREGVAAFLEKRKPSWAVDA
jgi:methylglutaconyl-CoA hydratase